MRFSVTVLVVCVIVATAVADIAKIKSTKAKLIGRLPGKHHKRGILSSIPPFKLGYDIPVVTHSVVKPLVVTYPPTASVAAVKIPVAGPHPPRYPVPVGHKVPGLPHPHYGLNFPHTKFVAKPDHHFHHHHHHVSPRPVIPLVPAPIPATPVSHVAPVVPAPAPTIAVAHAAPLPPQPVAVPTSVITQPLPVPAPPVPIFNHNLHFKPLLPAAPVPLPQAPVFPAPVLPAPVLPVHQAFPYVIRPGGAVQTSLFATYPRYPLINSYQAPLIPYAAAAPAIPTISQVLLERPNIHSYPIIAHGAAPHEVIEHNPNIVVGQTPTHVHHAQTVPEPAVQLHTNQETVPQPSFNLLPTQLVPQPSVPIQPTQATYPTHNVDHNGWSPVVESAQPHDLATSHEAHYPQTHHFTQEQGSQVYEHHTENQFHEYQHHLQHQLQQIEQSQYEQNLHNQQQQPAPEYGVPQQLGQEYGQPNEYSQGGQNFVQNQQDFQNVHDFVQHGQDFAQHGQHEQDFSQHGPDFAQHGQDFSQHAPDFSQQGQDFSQHTQDYNQNNYNVANLGQEYGLPQQRVEGRNAEDVDDQQYHNHIPLGLQPPIDRPLEHFQ